MKKVIVTNSGRGAGINFCKSLRLADEKIELICLDKDKYSMLASEADKLYYCPPATSDEYLPFLKKVIKETGADFLYPSKTNEDLWVISKHRDELGIKTFLPPDEEIQIYEDKFKTYNILKDAGIKVPYTIMIHNEKELENAIKDIKGGIWLREVIGCGGKGSIPTDDFELAKAWINRFNGWGKFSASEILTDKTATWSGIWNNGELVISQVRKRLYWEYGYLTPSGVTGITGAQITAKDRIIDDIAMKAIKAISKKPHGIISVDFTYDKEGYPNVTEIQASRFYSSTYFMAKAGLNLPHILLKIAFGEELPEFDTKFSPLEENLLWIKHVDCLPVLTKLDKVGKEYGKIEI